jgi:arylsulfatase A-like enzyme
MAVGPARPNILLALPDRLPFKAVDATSPCHTPNLRKLAQNGICFENTYTTTPLCTPARASILTGLYPHQHKLTHNTHVVSHFISNLPRNIPTLGEILKKSGYATRYVGKWHVGQESPVDRGFEEWTPIEQHDERELENLDQCVNFFEEWNSSPLAARSSVQAEETEPFRNARSVNGLLEKHVRSGSEDPFFIFTSTSTPHSPWIIPEPFASMHDPSALKMWDNYTDDRMDKPVAFHKTFMFHHYCRIDDNWDKLDDALAKFYGALCLVDSAFGSILSKMEELGLSENTVVIFTSDHGDLLGAHGLLGMAETMAEELIHVPLVISWPMKFKPAIKKELVTGCDLFNTIAELSGNEHMINPAMDGRSLVPLLSGEKTTWREAVFSEHHGSGHLNLVRVIRTERYKYVFRANEIDELYDLQEDPGELINQADNPSFQPVLWDLRDKLLEVLDRTDDPFVNAATNQFCQMLIQTVSISEAEKAQKRKKFIQLRARTKSKAPEHGTF